MRGKERDECCYSMKLSMGHRRGKERDVASTTVVTNFIYGYMAREETRCGHIGYSFRLAARVVLYASSHRQDNTYHSLCYTSRGALAGTRSSSMGPP